MDKLDMIVKKLSDGEKLDRKYKDHALLGKYIERRILKCLDTECHIESDWILIYYIMDEDLVLRLSRTGSHSKLFLFC